MSHQDETTRNPVNEEEVEDDVDSQLNEEDIVEVHEDDDDQPMDDDDDDNEKYDGEIVIGAPMPGEEEAMENMYEDNTLGSTCKCKPPPHPCQLHDDGMWC